MIRRWALAALAALVLLSAEIAPAAAQLPSPALTWITEGLHAWQAGQLSGLAITTAGLLQLGHDAPAPPPTLGTQSRFGLYDSPVHATAPFRRVQLDYSARVPAGAELRLMARASADGTRWSEWRSAAPGGHVAFDRVGRFLQYRAMLLGSEQSPSLEAVQLTPLPLTDEDHVVSKLHEDQVAPTYRLRATREGLVGQRTANGHVIKWMDRFVSLPSWRPLSSRGGYEYVVRLTNPANGRSTTAPVWDVGPWNRHDDFWNEDREWYKDLPVGWPEDHAAFYQGYNKGYAEVSGKVLWPAAIDVGDGTWVEDLGIAYKNEQTTLLVTFLWQGKDPGGDPDIQPGPPAHNLEDGSVIIDDLTAGFDNGKEFWQEMKCGFHRHSWWSYSTPNEAEAYYSATWRPTLREGFYEVYAYIPHCVNGIPDTRDARYTIQHKDGSEVVSVNQAANTSHWVRLGRWYFAEGSEGLVKLSNLAGDKRRSVWFDAVKWVPAP